MSAGSEEIIKGPLAAHSTDILNENQSREALSLLSRMNIILLGIPGAGKTTLSQELRSRNSEINYISLGDISRHLPADSLERQELDRLFAIGSPVGVPEFFCRLIEPYIDMAMEQQKGFILDGIPKKAEEVQPLLDMLASKGTRVDMVVSCELPSMTAYDRIASRDEREGDPDTLEIFANRTALYMSDLDEFKEKLTGEYEVPLIVVDTEEHGVADAATRVIDYVQNLINHEQAETNEAARQSELYEAVCAGDKKAIITLIGSDFDDVLPELSHSMLYGKDLSPEQKQALVEEALSAQDQHLHETPRFLKRLAKNYIDTTFASLEHLSASLIEEAANRYGEDFTSENIQEILQQQLGLKEIIETLQNEIVGNKNLSDLVNDEMQVNADELAYIQEVLAGRANALGFDAKSYQDLVNLQPKLWGLLTSNQILFSPDYNYRSSSNSIPGSHHSLLPFTKNRRALTATSMGEYVPFIEAVSASEYKYGSTFGFIHFMGMDATGEAYAAEYPIMMHDQRLLNLNNPTVNGILESVESFYSNHDLWHNLLPVYADHFILHHAHAPLSYGGRLPEYVDFGRKLRTEKEEYEIGVAMSHARTQQERFERNPQLREQQLNLLFDALDKIPQLRDELRGTCSAEEIEDIVDHLAVKTARKAYNVLRAEDPVYATIEQKLATIGFPTMTLEASDVATLLWKQGLVDKGRVREMVAQTGKTEEDIVARFKTDRDFAASILQHVGLDQPDRESGAEHIVGALDSWGVLEAVRANGSAEIGGMDKIRWLAIVAPQREQLKGHMEKVHGKPGYIFGDEVLPDARDLVLLQHKAIEANAPHYEYRQQARTANQRLSYRAYSLLFDDNQDVMRAERELMDYLRHTVNDGALRTSTRDAVAGLDKVMDALVSCRYDVTAADIATIESYSQMLGYTQIPGANSLANALQRVTNDYNSLTAAERAYQDQLGRDYIEAEKRLLDDQMTII